MDSIIIPVMTIQKEKDLFSLKASTNIKLIIYTQRDSKPFQLIPLLLLHIQIMNDKGIMETEASIGAMSTGGLSRQTSITKTNCICSPTTHPGSFRCKLHRTPSLHRTKSVETNILQNLMTKPDDSSTGDEAAK